MEKKRSGKKRNFSEVEINTLTSEVEQNRHVLFGSLKTRIKGAQKNAVWKKITGAVNSVATEERTPAKVKKKWSDLKLATKKRVAALRRSSTETGGGPPDPSLTLTATEEKISSLIGAASIIGVCGGGGDTDDLPSELDHNGNQHIHHISETSNQVLSPPHSPQHSIDQCNIMQNCTGQNDVAHFLGGVEQRSSSCAETEPPAFEQSQTPFHIYACPHC
uniref:Myb/SANT-like DNA-binding domain-containing protein n=1 Tax=Salarias fasciatus TaxID=181472 RepID=A0A672G0Y3_SALFA